MSKYIDKIFYINLNHRTDRRQEIETELKSFNLEAERFEGISVPNQGILGCGRSHLQVLKIAKERGYKNVLILEDDFEFLVSKTEFEHLLESFFKQQISYDVLFLSYAAIQNEAIPNQEIIRRGLEVQTASGYIVANHYYDSLISLYEWAMPLLETTQEHWNYANDQVWKSLQPNDRWYYFVTRIGKQRKSFSDNALIETDYNH